MQAFSITDENVVICDTPQCWAQVRHLDVGAQIGGVDAPLVEVVLCVAEGEMIATVGASTYILGDMEALQIPAGQSWSAQAGTAGARMLRVHSMHPNLAPEEALMPALARPHKIPIAAGGKGVYTDYYRVGVLNFAPGFAAEKHFHQDADEIFWFFQGICRVTTPDGAHMVPTGTIVLTPAGEWHIIENAGDEPLLMFLTVAPNIVPHHTYFDAEGRPQVRDWKPLTKMG